MSSMKRGAQALVWGALCALGVAASNGCQVEPARARAEPEQQRVAVRLSDVVRGELDLPVRAPGTLGARRELELSFKVGGVVTQVVPEEGARVKKGQLLAAVNPTELEAQRSQARQTLEKAERDAARSQELHARGSLPRVDAQNAATGLAVAHATYEAAAFNLQHARIYAPESGVIDRRSVHVGEVVGAGRAVFHLRTSGQGPVARVSLIDRDILAIAPGDRARVTLDALPDRSFAAVVSQMASAATAGTGMFPIELTLDDPAAQTLPSGLTVKVEIDHHEASTVRVPVAALVEGRGHDAVVYALADGVAGEGARVRRVPVRVRAFTTDSALLAADVPGLTQVVSTGASFLHDGALVRVLP